MVGEKKNELRKANKPPLCFVSAVDGSAGACKQSSQQILALYLNGALGKVYLLCLVSDEKRSPKAYIIQCLKRI
jgi:hypothetical protein